MGEFMKKALPIIFIIFQFASMAGIGIGYSQTGPLPVELTSFTRKIINSSIELTWQTAAEIDNYGFEMERAFYPPKSYGLPLSDVSEDVKGWLF